MPQESLGERLRRSSSGIPEPLPPSAPVEHPWSVGGFTENAFNDAFDLGKGLFSIFPTAAKAGYDILKDPAGIALLAHHPEALGQSLKDTAVAVKDAIIEPYQKYGLGVVYHRPVSTLLDALTVLDLGASSLARAGKIAGSARLVEMAEKLRALPASLASKGIDAAAAKVGINLPKMREFSNLKRTVAMERNVRTANDFDAIASKIGDLDEASRADLDRWISQGVTKEEFASKPNVAEAWQAWNDHLKATVEPRLEMEGLLSPAKREETLAKKYAAEVFGDTKAENVAKAREAIAKLKANGDVAPIYGHAMFEKGGGLDLGELFASGGEIREGKVGFLENFTGAKGRVKDPLQYIAKSIKDFRALEAKLDLAKRVHGNPEWVKAARAGEEGAEPALKIGVNKGYVENPSEARGIAVGERQRAGMTGDEIARDKTVQQSTHVIYDKTIKRLLQMEFTHWTGTPGAMLRVYDRIISLFKTAATRLNPKWVTGNVVGDAMLASLAGSDWATARTLIKGSKRFAAIHGGAGLAEESSSLAGRLLDRAADIAGQADQAARAGIITKAFAEEIKKAGLSFEMSAETAESLLRSSEQFHQVNVHMQMAREQIARKSGSVQRLDRLVNKLVERERLWAEKVAQAEAVAQSPGEAKIAQRIKTLEDAKQAFLERIGIEKQGAAKARREVRQLVKQVPPDDLRRAVKQALARYNLTVADAQLDALISSTREQATLSEGFKTARAQAKAQAGRMAESVEARAGKIDASRRTLEQIRQKIVNLGSEREQIIADILHDAQKTEQYEAKIPGLKQQDDIVRHGVDRANAFVGDYLGMNGFEQGVMRRLVPFYAWSKAMTMLAFRLPFLAPVKTFLWHRYAMAMMSMVGDKELPEWLQGYVPVMARENGDLVWFKLSGFSPFQGTRVTHYGNVPLPNVLAAHEANPLISLTIRLAGGRTSFDRSTLPYGEQMVNISNGDVYQFTENGTIRKTVPQAPLVGSIAHMFPVTQLIEDVITPFQASSHNWIGLPQPTLNQDGTYKYPREWWQRLGSLVGLNLMGRSRESAINAEKVNAKRALDALKIQYKKADPDEREYIRGVFEDISRSGRLPRVEAQ